MCVNEWSYRALLTIVGLTLIKQAEADMEGQ